MRNVIFVILCVSTTWNSGEELTRKDFSSSSSDRVLSRRKRYLIFPEGSSLQLGGTAALAWELPHDPFQPYRKHAELLHRKDLPGEYIVKDPAGKYKIKDRIQTKQSVPQSGVTYLGTVPMRYPTLQRPLIRQPVRYPSINYSPSYNRYRYHHYRSQQMPYMRTNPNSQQQQIKLQSKAPAPVYYRQELPVTSRTNAKRFYGESSPPTPFPSIYHQVHRRTRRELYGKIEKFLSAQSKDGRACLLKIICETHQKGSEKGSFMEEIMKAVFRVKPTDEHADEDLYDQAANKSHNCTEMFPTCDASILHFI